MSESGTKKNSSSERDVATEPAKKRLSCSFFHEQKHRSQTQKNHQKIFVTEIKMMI